MSVKLLVIVIIDFKQYPSTYCLMQGSCVLFINVLNAHKNSTLDSQHLKTFEQLKRI